MLCCFNNLAPQYLTYAATVTPVLRNGGYCIVRYVTGNMQFLTPSGTPKDGDELVVQWCQDGAGGYAVTFNSSYTTLGTFGTVYGNWTTIKFMYSYSKWRQVSISTGVPT